jgi:hypothetical protein
VTESATAARTRNRLNYPKQHGSIDFAEVLCKLRLRCLGRRSSCCVFSAKLGHDSITIQQNGRAVLDAAQTCFKLDAERWVDVRGGLALVELVELSAQQCTLFFRKLLDLLEELGHARHTATILNTAGGFMPLRQW